MPNGRFARGRKKEKTRIEKAGNQKSENEQKDGEYTPNEGKKVSLHDGAHDIFSGRAYASLFSRSMTA